MATTLIFLGLFILSLGISNAAPLELFVDVKHGSDANTGIQTSPFATIVRARAAIRALAGKIPTGGITVQIRAGDYDFTQSPLQLTTADSGNAQSQITYTSYQSEPVRLTAGQILPTSAFAPFKPGSNILKVNLGKFGINQFGKLWSGGLGSCSGSKLEVFYNSNPMYLARYPNLSSNGTWQWDTIATVSNSSSFTYTGNRPSSWTSAPDLWLHGYWSFDWADSYVRVSKIETNQNTFVIDPQTPPLYGLVKNARYYALNLLEELDAPNEYYLDRQTGDLYLIPPGKFAPSDEIVVSIGDSVISMQGTQYVTLQNLRIEFAQTTAVIIENAFHVNVLGCTISNNGAHSVQLSGTSSSVSNGTIFGNGCSGIIISGGNQTSLTPGNISVNNNHIYQYARWIRTYNPGVSWRGVGHLVQGNYIHDAPHNGILGGGNNCLFQGNYLKDLCYEVSDSGAFYTGRSWIERGNILRDNVFENIFMREQIHLGWPSVQAVYLDDQMSGWQVENNTFLNCSTGVVVGGGRRNVVKNNHFLNCNLGVHFDNRGMNWQNDSCAPGGQFEQQLNSVNYKQPPWSKAYPYLTTIMQDHPCVPVYNHIDQNSYCNSPKFLDATAEQVQEWLSTADDNTQTHIC